ncbi:hypothetical protein O9993_09335 [Vibrio lentus]|nr:hypothetical protein [Vibrio lentus]
MKSRGSWISRWLTKQPTESRIDLAINNVNSAEYVLRVISEPSIEVKVSAKDISSRKTYCSACWRLV